MLTALNEQGVQIRADAAVRGVSYQCPACGAAVTLKQGQRVLAHFAHRPEAPCPIQSEPETAAHLQMKTAVYQRFQSEPWVRRCMVEQVIGARRADVWLDTAVGPIAVEGQVSLVTVEELAAKLADYTAQGIATLYLVHESVVGSLATGMEARIPAWVLALHALYRGRVYVFQGERIVPVHLEAVVRENTGRAGPPERRLKATRTLQVGAPIADVELRCSLVECKYGALGGGRYLVASFDEGRFW